jgi:hypothetical protein
VADGPRAAQSSRSLTRREKQPSAAPIAQQWRRRLSARCVQGSAQTKEGPRREIKRYKSIKYHPSTTLNARTGRRIRIGLGRAGQTGRSVCGQRPKGVGHRSKAGGSAPPANAVRLVVRGANVDACTCLPFPRPPGACPSLCASTTTSGARPAMKAKEEREEAAGPAHTARPPRWGTKHGGNTQEHTGSARLSIDRPPRRGRASCPQAGPSSQQQGELRRCSAHQGIVCTDPAMDSASRGGSVRARVVPLDSKSSGAKSPPGRRGGGGGRTGQRGRGRTARRHAQVGMGHRHGSACAEEAVEHLFLHGHTSARPLVSDCAAAGASPGPQGGPRLRERAARAGSVLQGSKAWLRVASPRRGTPLPPTSPTSESDEGGLDQRGIFLCRVRNQSDTPQNDLHDDKRYGHRTTSNFKNN